MTNTPRWLPWLAYGLAILSIIEGVLHLLPPESRLYTHIILVVILIYLGLMAHGYIGSVAHQLQAYKEIKAELTKLGQKVPSSSIVEILPTEIQKSGKEFCERCDGEMHWFNVPLGRCIPPHFTEFLLPAIKNERVTEIVFMLDESVKESWERLVEPLVKEAEKRHMKRSKVVVLYHRLRDSGHYMAFKMINVKSPRGLVPEAHVTFYDEDWMEKISVSSKAELAPKRFVHVLPETKMFDALVALCERYYHRATV